VGSFTVRRLTRRQLLSLHHRALHAFRRVGQHQLRAERLDVAAQGAFESAKAWETSFSLHTFKGWKPGAFIQAMGGQLRLNPKP
jgi:hypothetical protein